MNHMDPNIPEFFVYEEPVKHLLSCDSKLICRGVILDWQTGELAWFDKFITGPVTKPILMLCKPTEIVRFQFLTFWDRTRPVVKILIYKN